jgi:hypothetical protein
MLWIERDGFAPVSANANLNQVIIEFVGIDGWSSI